MKARQLLTANEIAELDAALIEAFRQHAALLERLPAARYIKRPALPAVLSESLVGHALLDLLAAETVTFGGSEADLRLMRRGQPDQLVEVKASGASSFVELKPRDVVRDLLVWADFGRRYETGAGAITLHILRRPRQYHPPRAKLTLDRFLADTRELEEYESLTIASLDDFLHSR